jgi:hypothetical protein
MTYDKEAKQPPGLFTIDVKHNLFTDIFCTLFD